MHTVPHLLTQLPQLILSQTYPSRLALTCDCQPAELGSNVCSPRPLQLVLVSIEAFTDFHYSDRFKGEAGFVGRRQPINVAEILLASIRLRLVSLTTPRSVTEVIFFQMLFSCCRLQPTQQAPSASLPLSTIFHSYFSHHHNLQGAFLSTTSYFPFLHFPASSPYSPTKTPQPNPPPHPALSTTYALTHASTHSLSQWSHSLPVPTHE